MVTYNKCITGFGVSYTKYINFSNRINKEHFIGDVHMVTKR